MDIGHYLELTLNSPKKFHMDVIKRINPGVAKMDAYALIYNLPVFDSNDKYHYSDYFVTIEQYTAAILSKPLGYNRLLILKCKVWYHLSQDVIEIFANTINILENIVQEHILACC